MRLGRIQRLLLLPSAFTHSFASAFVAMTRRRASSSSCLTARTQNFASSTSVTTAIAIEARTDCWRPTVNDVERISFGKPAKRKGTGSRGVPHRLNADERRQFDLARQRGYLEVTGSAWRSQRRDAPLLNTYRSLCDAKAQVSIVVHKQQTGMDDVVVDVSPLRLPENFGAVAEQFLQQQSGGRVVSQVDNESSNSNNDDDDDDDREKIAEEEDSAWETKPIYQLPPFCVAFEGLPRSEAKALGKNLATVFGTAELGKRAASKKPYGVKPGKSRRHGGYGIG